MSGDSPLIALFDVGKSNAKLSIVDPCAGVELWSARRANGTVTTGAIRELDIVAIEQWLLASLREAPARQRIARIVPVAHGAAAVLLDAEGRVLAAPDYEDPRFDEVAHEYAASRDVYASTFSPHLPAGLNLGRQLHFLERRHPASWRRAAHLLPYPQYWAWRLCGVMASEVTSLGTHTDLWCPRQQEYSALAIARGWSLLLPPLRNAAEKLGCVSDAVVAATGLDARCEVSCGVHDSNASYLRFLIGRDQQAFNVVSSGTWTVVMCNGGDLDRLREDRDMLANVNVFGAPVPTARYMGGREYQAIAAGGDAAAAVELSHELTVQQAMEPLRRVIADGAMALPAFASAGPFSGRAGRLVRAQRLDGPGRAALATLYSALMTTLLIESLGVRGDTFIDGPLAGNPLFPGVLSTLLGSSVRMHSGGADTRVAAHLARLPVSAEENLQTAAPLRVSGLAEYRAAWCNELENST